MKKYIKIVFKDNMEHLFNANAFSFEDDGFCHLDFIDENDRENLVAYVSTATIKYMSFVEVVE